jgi:hypothetical protein
MPLAMRPCSFALKTSLVGGKPGGWNSASAALDWTWEAEMACGAMPDRPDRSPWPHPRQDPYGSLPDDIVGPNSIVLQTLRA